MKTYLSKNDKKLERILELYNEESIMEYYGIPLFVSFKNPFRVDNKPSCTCNYYNGNLLMTDWSYNKRFDIVKVAGLFYGYITMDNTDIDYDTYKMIISSMIYDLIDSKTEEEKAKIKKQKTMFIQEEIKINVKIRDWEDYDKEYWKPLNINTFKDLPTPIFPLAYATINNSTKCYNRPNNPTYGYFFKEHSTIEKQVWKIYKPLDTNGQKWLGNVRLYMTNKTDDKPEVLCTSYKDALSFRYITDLECMSYQSELYKPNYLDGIKYVVIDNNEVGIKYGEYLSDKFGVKIIKPMNTDVFEDLKNIPTYKLTDYYTKQL